MLHPASPRDVESPWRGLDIDWIVVAELLSALQPAWPSAHAQRSLLVFLRSYDAPVLPGREGSRPAARSWVAWHGRGL